MIAQMRELIVLESAEHEPIRASVIFFPPHRQEQGGEGGEGDGMQGVDMPDARAADEAGAVSISAQIPHVKHE